MSELNLAMLVVGLIVILLGFLSRPVDRGLLTAPLIALGVGILLGPSVADLLDPARWGDQYKILAEAARFALGISLMGIALRLPRRFVQSHWRSLAILLVLVMPLMFAISAGLAGWLLGLTPVIAMLVGASICPTDPVVASSVVTGDLAQKAFPGSFRHLLSAEAGSNDGLAFPLVFLPILLFTHDSGAVWSEWLLRVWLYEVGGAVIFGLLVGWLAGKALGWAEAHHTIDQSSFLATTVALTFVALGGAALLSTNGLLAVFVAGLAFDQLVDGAQRAEEDNVQEAVNLFFTLPVFALFGMMLPVAEWRALGVGGLALAGAVLLLRRIPVVLALGRWLPEWRDSRTLWVAAWTGPIGISALYYSMEVHSKTGDSTAWVAGSLVVMASLIAHGVSAAPLARRHAKQVGRAIE